MLIELCFYCVRYFILCRDEMFWGIGSFLLGRMENCYGSVEVGRRFVEDSKGRV